MIGVADETSLTNILDVWQYFYAVFGQRQEYLCEYRLEWVRGMLVD